MKTVQPNGYVVYDGASRLNGADIVAIITGFVDPSDNPKTGDMLQVTFFPRDIKPNDAVKSGADAAVCGACPLRPVLAKLAKLADPIADIDRCYVETFFGPRSTWAAFQRGMYPRVSLAAIERLIRRSGKAVRLGAWGDPASVPLTVIKALTRGAKRFTGYTHQWPGMTRSAARLWQRFVMASCDPRMAHSMALSPAALQAHAAALGWRTFRVQRKAADPLLPGEISCPASDEAGKRTQCVRCGLCNGIQPSQHTGIDARKHIAIIAH